MLENKLPQMSIFNKGGKNEHCIRFDDWCLIKIIPNILKVLRIEILYHTHSIDQIFLTC
jgi:hypothetical protein